MGGGHRMGIPNMRDVIKMVLGYTQTSFADRANNERVEILYLQGHIKAAESRNLGRKRNSAVNTNASVVGIVMA